MSLRNYLVLGVIVTLLSWGAWTATLFFIDPFSAGAPGHTVFLASLFLALLGTCALLGFAVRRTFSRDGVAYSHINVSVRQAFFFSLALVGVLLLRHLGVFAWWSIALLVGGLTLLEAFFLTREHV